MPKYQSFPNRVLSLPGGRTVEFDAQGIAEVNDANVEPLEQMLATGRLTRVKRVDEESPTPKRRGGNGAAAPKGK